MVKSYFDNVVRNKPKHRLLLFHDAYKLLDNGDVYFISLRETNQATVYSLYVFDENLKYLFETSYTHWKSS